MPDPRTPTPEGLERAREIVHCTCPEVDMKGGTEYHFSNCPIGDRVHLDVAEALDQWGQERYEAGEADGCRGRCACKFSGDGHSEPTKQIQSCGEHERQLAEARAQGWREAGEACAARMQERLGAVNTASAVEDCERIARSPRIAQEGPKDAALAQAKEAP